MSVLNKRLILAAKLLENKKAVVDVGTDHAFLPIYMIKNNIAKKVIACDIAKGPLSVAEKNIKAHKLEDKIELRLADGLEAVCGNECDAITITGMGGETIAQIIDNAKWLFTGKKTHTLILQPMSCDDRLRRYLNSNGFEILEERAAFSKGRVYDVIKAAHRNVEPVEDKEFIYIGKLLENPTEAEFAFVFQRLKSMEKCIEEIKNVERKSKEYNELVVATERIKEKLRKF